VERVGLSFGAGETTQKAWTLDIVIDSSSNQDMDARTPAQRRKNMRTFSGKAFNILKNGLGTHGLAPNEGKNKGCAAKGESRRTGRAYPICLAFLTMEAIYSAWPPLASSILSFFFFELVLCPLYFFVFINNGD